MGIAIAGAEKKAMIDLGALSTAFDVGENTNPKDMFDWAINLSCPDCSKYVRHAKS
jgi:hypothetical protein